MADMHPDEIPTGPDLVRRLLVDQFPSHADLPITPVPSAGTDNALFRLGPELSVRMPRIGWAADAVEKEHRWLPILSPHLSMPVPEPIALGRPGHGYPCSWTICRWIPGTNPAVGATPDPEEAARRLAGFLRSLQAVDTTGGPPCRRGIPVSTRDAEVRTAVADLLAIQANDPAGDPAVEAIMTIDLAAVLAIWGRDAAASNWDRAPVWTHADLSPLNVLCDGDNRLSAVIDPYYYRTNPGLTAVSHQVLGQILDEEQLLSS